MSSRETNQQEKKAEQSVRLSDALDDAPGVKKERCDDRTNWDKIIRSPGSVHDGYFHIMLEDRVFAARYLYAYLPEKRRDALDLNDPSKIKVLSTEYFDERIKKHIADLFFSCRLKDVKNTSP